MGKATNRKLKYPNKEILSSYEIGGFIFKSNMKVVWNWASVVCKVKDTFIYVTIKIIYRENGVVYFHTEESNVQFDITSCMDQRFDMRPYNIRPRTIEDLDPKWVSKELILKEKLNRLIK